MFFERNHKTLSRHGRRSTARVHFILHRLLCAAAGLQTIPSATGHADPLRKSALLYENPFDLCAGGASLTRATQEGLFFSNPSLPALGSGFLRWIYGRTAVHFGADAIDLGRTVYKKKKAGTLKADSSLVESVLKTPIHVGNDVTLGFLTAFGGLGIFQTLRTDIEGRQFGSVGLPEIRTRAEAAAGVAALAAVPLGDTLALGVSVKPAYAAETFETIALSDFSGSGAKQLLTDLKKNTQYGLGFSGSAGVTAQFRTQNFDLRLAGTVDDVGQTKFSNPKVSPWKQTVNAGIGLIPHTSSNALHCAFDLRDIRGAYGEHWTRRSRAGCKALFFSRFGFGGGYYQGWPSYGVVFNLTLLRLEAGSYTREFGSEAGTRGRRVYFMATGFEIP
ncbi:MAG: hypothetical protein RIR26_1794 [Pseudomonadota bacterium]